MIEVNTDGLQKDSSRYLRAVEDGETIVVKRDDRAVAEINPVLRAARTLRPFGLCAGEFVVPDDFDAPLDSSTIEKCKGGSHATSEV